MARGRVRFDGDVVDLVGTAHDRVWLCDHPVDTGLASWRTGTGRHRVVGGPRPPSAEACEPTLEDAYLLMLGADAGAAAVLPA
jgi:ABC-2 type transport system ATP-binding protein